MKNVVAVRTAMSSSINRPASFSRMAQRMAVKEIAMATPDHSNAYLQSVRRYEDSINCFSDGIPQIPSSTRESGC